MRIFIHNVDTYLGQALVKDIRPFSEGCHRVFGTVVTDPDNAPKVVKRIVSRDDPKKADKMIQTIRSCKVVILDLFNSSLEDIYFLLAALGIDAKTSPAKPLKELENPITLIVVTSLMVWGQTQPRAKSPMERPDGDEGEPEDAEGEGAAEGADDVAAEEAPAEEEAAAEEAERAALEDSGEGGTPPKSASPPPLEVAPCATRTPSPLLSAAGWAKPLRDTDWPTRQPAQGSRYAVWRDWEALIEQCFNPPQTDDEEQPASQVKAFFVAGGLLYGEGEDLLGNLFKECWQGNPQHLVQGPGTNLVPTVHVRDLARLVRYVAVNADTLDPKEKPCFLAVDQPPPAQGGQPCRCSSQMDLLQSVVGEVCGDVPLQNEEARPVSPGAEDGSNEVSAAPEFGPSKELREHLSLDLWIEPSEVMRDPEQVEAWNADMPEKHVPGWWCKAGLASGVRMVAEEFCKKRELRCMRLIISGPPGSGVSTLAKEVASHFRLPHLELLAGEASPDAEEGEVPQPVVRSYRTKDAPPTAELSFESSVCRYRGFVLDAGQAGHAEMEKLFFKDDDGSAKRADGEEGEEEAVEEEEPPAEEPPAEEGEGGAEGEEAAPKPKPKKKVKRIFNKELCPQFSVVLQAPEPLCRARWLSARGGGGKDNDKLLAEYQSLADAYDKATNPKGQTKNFTDFFQIDANVGILNLPIVGRFADELFESTRIYMERYGRPFNYLPPEDEVAEELLARRKEKEDEARRRAEEAESQQRGNSKDKRAGEIALVEARLKACDEHEARRAEIEALPLREYLMRYMVPEVTEGLIEVCKVLPKDPTDYLANLLEERAAHIASQGVGATAR